MTPYEKFRCALDRLTQLGKSPKQVVKTAETYGYEAMQNLCPAYRNRTRTPGDGSDAGQGLGKLQALIDEYIGAASITRPTLTAMQKAAEYIEGDENALADFQQVVQQAVADDPTRAKPIVFVLASTMHVGVDLLPAQRRRADRLTKRATTKILDGLDVRAVGVNWLETNETELRDVIGRTQEAARTWDAKRGSFVDHFRDAVSVQAWQSGMPAADWIEYSQGGWFQ